MTETQVGTYVIILVNGLTGLIYKPTFANLFPGFAFLEWNYPGIGYDKMGEAPAFEGFNLFSATIVGFGLPSHIYLVLYHSKSIWALRGLVPVFQYYMAIYISLMFSDGWGARNGGLVILLVLPTHGIITIS